MHGVDLIGSFVLRPNLRSRSRFRWLQAATGAHTIVRGWGWASKPYLDAAFCDVFFFTAVDVTSRAFRSILTIEVYRIPCPWSGAN
jgi:hypothetical protein